MARSITWEGTVLGAMVALTACAAYPKLSAAAERAGKTVVGGIWSPVRRVFWRVQEEIEDIVVDAQRERQHRAAHRLAKQ